MLASPPLRNVFQIATLAALYFGVGKVGLLMSVADTAASPVWPGSGIALAALLLFGSRLWPGIMVGAFLLNVSAGVSPLAALGIAAGSTLEATLGVYLLQRVAGFANQLNRLRAVLAFVVLAAGLSTLVAAALGVASLYLWSGLPQSNLASTWWVWWLGDAVGDLVVGSVLLAWADARGGLGVRRSNLEAILLSLGLGLASWLVFSGQVPLEISHYPLPYVIFLFVIWAALRFGPRGATAATAVVAVIAIWQTVSGAGPFVNGSGTENLLSLQTFIGVEAVTALILAAVMTERQANEEALRQANDQLETRVKERTAALDQTNLALQTEIVQRQQADAAVRRQNQYLEALHATTLELMNRLDLAGLLEALIRRAGELLGTTHGYIYLVSADETLLELKVGLGVFAQDQPMQRGEGLAGKVWESDTSLIIQDYDQWDGRSPSFPRQLIRGIAGAPLTRKIGASATATQVVGVLGMAYGAETTRAFGPAEVDLLNRFARLASIALDNAQLFETAERQVSQLEAVRRASLGLTSSLELPAVLQAIVESVFQLSADTRDVYIYLYQDARLTFGAARWNDGRQAPLTDPVPGGTSWHVAHNGQLIVIPDMRTHPLYAAVHDDPDWQEYIQGAIVYLPLKFGEQVVGVMTSAYHPPQDIPTAKLRVLQLLADQAAIAIENARLFTTAQQELTERKQAEARLRQTYTELELRAKQLDLISQIGRQATLLTETTTLLSHIASLIRDAFDYYAVLILLVDQDLQQVRLTGAAAMPEVGALNFGASLPLNPESIIGNVAHTNQALLAGDVRVEPHYRYHPRFPRTASEAALPLRANNEVIGVLDLESVELLAFRPSDERVLQTLADQIAVTINNLRLFQAEAEARRRADALRRVGQMVGATLNLDEVLKLILTSLSEVIPYDSATILLLKGDALYIRAGSGFGGAEAVVGFRLPLADYTLNREVIETGQPIVLRDARLDARWQGETTPGSRPVCGWMGIPLVASGQRLGMLTVDNFQPDAYQQLDLSLALIFANQVAIALHNAELFQAEEAARRRADTLREVGQLVGSTLNLDEVLERILASLSEVLPYDSGFIMLLKNGVLFIQAGRGFDDPTTVLGYRLPLADYPLIQEVIETGRPIIVDDVRADPRWRDKQIVANPVRTWMGVPLIAGSQVIGMLAIDSYQPSAYDVADLPLATTFANQAAIALHNAELFQSAEAARAEAEEANRLKSRFLANMSHELRTPLNSIINFAYLLTLGTEGDLTEGQTDLLNRIGDAGRHLLGLINDILDLAKIESGRLELYLEEVELPELVRGALSTAIGLLRDKPVELINQAPDELPLARADRTRVRQVLLNLLSNAAKFTERGQIVVRATYDETWITLSVQDSGEGMTEEDIPKAFMEFVQIEGKTTRHTGGTGLGLPISKRFVEMHGGRMWAESTVGVGSTFYFTLPRLAPDLSKAPGLGEALTEARVLIIDDDRVMGDAIAQQLARNYQVLKSTESQHAAETVRRERPDVIVLDVMSPNQNSWEILRALKSDPETRNIPIVMCSMSHSEEPALSLAASEYLVKPVGKEELRNVIERFAPLGGKVLAVDDDPNALEIVRRILGGMSYQVSSAQNGRAGLEAAREQIPDVVVLDLMMPELNGFEVLAELRADPRTAKVPVVVVTAKDLTLEEQAQLQAGAATMLQKGQFTAEELSNAVRRAATRGVGG